MADLEFGRTSNTLHHSADYQRHPMPLDSAAEQDFVQNLPLDVDDYFSSEYFSNTSSSPELADYMQAYCHFNYLPSPSHDADMLSPTNQQSANYSPKERQNPSITQTVQVPQMTEIQLREASRKPKNRRYKVISNASAQARECHHLAEKLYRTRLKAQFESLLAVLPASRTNTLADRDSAPSTGQVLSRGQVLDLARDRILQLEDEIRYLTSAMPNGYPLG
ncbi:hypothetical protein F52700_4406 [Fusarium sp. NRRL 52700]|nr:hypothetical protein F52700_4406 [Fusarium sp. NRRL 52700]